MQSRLRNLARAGILGLFLIVHAGAVVSAVFNVTVDSSVLSGNPGILVFDFIDGGPPNNSVILSAIVSDGTQGATSTAGDVTGSGPWLFTDAGGSFFNELQIPFNPMGSSLTYSFTTSDNPPDPSSFADSFSFFILDTDLVTPLITTNDPTGANAIFQLSFGLGEQGLLVYTADQADFSIAVVPQPSAVPEPGTLALLVVGIMALSARRHCKR
jgi:hypothetical protein